MPTDKRPLKVFLCHAHADRDAVSILYTRLTNDGVDAWLDKEKLLPGQDWELEIKKAVREADVVVVCLSKQFNQAGFRQKEVRLALDTAMEKPEGEIFIIPARLEECDNLESLRRWHWVDLFEENGYETLVRALQERASRLKNIVVRSSEPNKKYSQIHWEATDALQDGKPYISIDITSQENHLIKCHCYIKSLKLNEVSRDDLKRELVKHTNRVSWSGGSDEEVGIKYIDPMGFGKINLASLDSKDFIRTPLRFEMAKGAQSKDKDGKLLPFGKYEVELGLACSANGVDLPEIPIRIGFEYFVKESLYEDNVVKDGKAIQRTLHLLELNSA